MPPSLKIGTSNKAHSIGPRTIATLATIVIVCMAIGAWIFVRGQGDKNVPPLTNGQPILREVPEATYQGRRSSEWITRLRDKDASTRLEAVQAVAAIGEEAGVNATKALSEVVKDSNSTIRIAACSAQWRVSKEVEADTLAAIIQNRIEPLDIRIAALSVLLNISIEVQKMGLHEDVALIAESKIQIAATNLFFWIDKTMKEPGEDTSHMNSQELSKHVAELNFLVNVAGFCVKKSLVTQQNPEKPTKGNTK